MRARMEVVPSRVYYIACVFERYEKLHNMQKKVKNIHLY